MSRWISLVLVLLLSVFALQAQNEANAQVEDNWATLNMRTEPTVNAPIVVELSARTPLIVTGRTADNRWYQAQTLEGQSGWVAASYVDLRVAQSSIPVVDAPISTTNTSTSNTTNTENSSSPAPVAATGGTNARVTAIGLNMRSIPSLGGSVIAELSQGTRILVTGRSNTSVWLQIQLTDGRTGWVAARYVALDVALSSIPLANSSGVSSTSSSGATSSTANNVTVTVPAGQAPYFTLGANAASIWATGQSLGNRANVFSKVGDSISTDEVSYRPIGYGVFNLGDFDYLQGTISFFSAGAARTDNPFNNASLAANGGWTTQNILSPEFANSTVCEAGEIPLVCEYRLNRPSVALIQVGSNDTTFVAIDQFAYNMRVIANISIDMGVIPVLTTIPPRLDFPGRAEAYNQMIIDVAREKGLPLWDYYSAIAGLPNAGMAEDGLHPSMPPSGFVNGANFSPSYLQYGYVMRNLTMLQALHVIRSNVLR